MDELCWHLYGHVQQLVNTYEQFQYYPCITPDVIQAFPSGALDMILTVDSIPWPGLDLQSPLFFQHPGIAHTRFVAEPVEHFFIHGTMDALQHCFQRAMLFNIMERLRRIFNRMVLQGDTLIPPCPPRQLATAPPDLNGTIHLTEQQCALALPPPGNASVPQF
jgi:hypothetical protein